MFPIDKINEELRPYSLPEEIFDLYRIVDPITHRELGLSPEGELFETGNSCHDIWERGGPCQNCISMHTCNEQKQYFKMEFIHDTVYLIFSVPIHLNGDKYSLEIVKDVTDSMFIANKFNNDKTEAVKVIDKFNAIAVRDILTGLYNKKYALDQLQKYLSDDNTVFISAITVDITGLLSINNNYGHAMGDKVLKRVSAILFSLVEPPTSFAVRLESDNFALFYQNEYLKEVETVMKKIKDLVRSLVFEKDGESFGVSVKTDLVARDQDESAEKYFNRLQESTKKQ